MVDLSKVDRFNELTDSEAVHTCGGNIFSQARDVIWGFIDGFEGHRESSSKRHRG